MRASAPPPLRVAVVLVAVEALVMAGLTVFVLLGVGRDRLTLGLTTAVFFAAYTALLAASALALRRLSGWPRGPVLITQLIALGLAFNLRDTLLVAVPLAVLGVAVIAGLLHPASIDALARAENPDA